MFEYWFKKSESRTGNFSKKLFLWLLDDAQFVTRCRMSKLLPEDFRIELRLEYPSNSKKALKPKQQYLIVVIISAKIHFHLLVGDCNGILTSARYYAMLHLHTRQCLKLCDARVKGLCHPQVYMWHFSYIFRFSLAVIMYWVESNTLLNEMLYVTLC